MRKNRVFLERETGKESSIHQPASPPPLPRPLPLPRQKIPARSPLSALNNERGNLETRDTVNKDGGNFVNCIIGNWNILCLLVIWWVFNLWHPSFGKKGKHDVFFWAAMFGLLARRLKLNCAKGTKPIAKLVSKNISFFLHRILMWLREQLFWAWILLMHGKGDKISAIIWPMQGRSQGRVQAVLDPPPPPLCLCPWLFRISRDEIFAFEEKDRKI